MAVRMTQVMTKRIALLKMEAHVAKIFVFNGRSVVGILGDALQVFPAATPVVVMAKDDRLPPPAGVATMTVEETVEWLVSDETTGADEENDHVVLVANGGMASQLVPVLLALTKGWSFFHGTYAVVNLQRDGLTVLDERTYPLNEMHKPLGKATKSDVHNICW